MSNLRILFAGTPEFAVPPLAALLDAGHQVVAVYTQPDRPAGRGRQIQPSPVKALALERGIPVEQPVSLKRDPEAVDRLRALAPDLMIVVAYGLLLPPVVLEIPRLGCVNVHASLLPRWRGAAPIQRAVLAGDPETGVCVMRMEEGLDTGPVYRRLATPIGPRETAGQLHDRLASLGAQALLEALPDILAGAVPEPQNPALATYANKLVKEEARIDWFAPAERTACQIRAFDPWPVAEARLDGTVLRIWEAEALSKPTEAKPGTVLETGRDGILVATGAGILRILRLQAPGKRPMSARDFLNARSLDGQKFD